MLLWWIDVRQSVPSADPALSADSYYQDLWIVIDQLTSFYLYSYPLYGCYIDF